MVPGFRFALIGEPGRVSFGKRKVVTLPHELNPLLLASERNRRALLGLLFHAVADTLLTFGHHNLGGKVGFTSVLHTWDQQIRAHFHVHGVIAGGAIAQDGGKWLPAGKTFLFGVRALSKVFRVTYMERLQQWLDKNELDLPPRLSQLRVSGNSKHVERCRERPLCRSG